MSRRQRLLIPYEISMINYYEYCVVENEHLYGPGKRVLLFLQGCSIHCEGCVNRHLWDFGKGKNATSEEIISFCRDNHVEGITLHGGEPLDQSEGLYPIVKALKKEQFTVILFTGYTKRELNIGQKRVWNLSDIVVCGRFDLKKRNVYLQFRGSINQRIIRRKGKYKHYQVQDGTTVAILTIDLEGNLNIKGFYTEGIAKLSKMVKNSLN